MKKIFSSVLVFCLLVSIMAPVVYGESNASSTSSEREITEAEKDLLKKLTIDDTKLIFDVSEIENRVKADIEKLNKLDRDKFTNRNPFQIQVFEGVENRELFNKTFISPKELSNIDIVIPQDIKEKFKNDDYYKIPIHVIIVTPKSTAKIYFERIVINNLNNLSKNKKFMIADYIQFNNLNKPLIPNFFESGKSLYLSNVSESVSLQSNSANTSEGKSGDVGINDTCGGDCTGYYLVSSDPVIKDVIIAEIHAIKGVDTVFAVGHNETSSTSMEVKAIGKFGGISVSGSSLQERSLETTWSLTGSGISSPGKEVVTRFNFDKNVWRKLNDPNDEFTEFVPTSWNGDTLYGANKWSNGESYDSVSGSEHQPGTSIRIGHKQQTTVNVAFQISAYGFEGTGGHTLQYTDATSWHFTFKSGYGYKWYKVYNRYFPNNLTAK
jgi:hypothetical protein